MGTRFPTLPASHIKWEKGIARALKRIMGRQGVIMALVSNPLNSLKTRERVKRQKGVGLLATLAGGRGGRTGAACHPALTVWSIRDAEPLQRVLTCPGSSLLCKGKVPALSLLGSWLPPLLPGPLRAPLRESVVFAQQRGSQGWQEKGLPVVGLQERLGTLISMRSRGQRSASSS